jgi:hypothetical protein
MVGEDNLRYGSVAEYSPDSNGVNMEAEESPMLRLVTGKRLVKNGRGIVIAGSCY